MYPTWLADARLYAMLARIDEDLAAMASEARCAVCGSVLHVATFPRKPRGAAAALPDGYDRRHSFCCAGRECRKRFTPPSVRYLGRKVYLGAVVVLAAACRQGLTRRRVARLREMLGVTARTLERWRLWWSVAFAESPWWKAARALLSPPVATSALPRSLLERFPGADWAPLVALLHFVAPTTTSLEAAQLFEGGRRPAEDAL